MYRRDVSEANKLEKIAEKSRDEVNRIFFKFVPNCEKENILFSNLGIECTEQYTKRVGNVSRHIR